MIQTMNFTESALRRELAAHEINPVTGEPSHCVCDVCDAARALLRDHALIEKHRATLNRWAGDRR